MKKIIAVAVSVMALASVSLVFAKENDQGNTRQKKAAAVQELKTKIADWKTERQAKLESLKLEKEQFRAQFKEEMTQEKCAKIEARLQNRTEKFGAAKEKHMSVYNNLLARIDKFITRFQEFDSANPGKITPETLQALETDRDALALKITEFKTAYSEYSTKLGVTKNFTCGQTEGEFRVTLSDAKAYLTGVHTAAANIRIFVRTEIYPDLLAIKKEIAKARGAEGDGNSEEENGTEEEADETETPDTTAPIVSISSPAEGTYTTAQTVTFTATATDNNKVKKVEFYDGTTLKGTDTKAPFTYSWVITDSETEGAHSWTAKAYDGAEPANVTTSAAVSLTVNLVP